MMMLLWRSMCCAVALSLPSYTLATGPLSDATSVANLASTPESGSRGGAAEVEASGASATVEAVGGNGTLSTGMSLSQVFISEGAHATMLTVGDLCLPVSSYTRLKHSLQCAQSLALQPV